jgi:ribonuclease P protein component
VKRALSLRSGLDFQRVWDDGKSWLHPLLVLRARANGMETSRFGFVASKKIGTIVARNRAKRLMRDAVRQCLPRIAPGWDLVFIARGDVAKAEFKDVDAVVENLLRRAHLINITEHAIRDACSVKQVR